MEERGAKMSKPRTDRHVRLHPDSVSHDVADSDLRLPLADNRQSWRQPSASPREFGCRSWTLRTAAAAQARALRESSHSARPRQLGRSLGRAASHASFKHWDLGGVRLCSTRRSMLIEPVLAHPPEVSVVHNRDPQSERIAAVVSPTRTPMMNHICSLSGTSPASRNPRRRQRRRRSLARSTVSPRDAGLV